MENKKLRKMAFYEVGSGKLFADMQGSFEMAQEVADEIGQPVSVVLTIKVYPPDPENDRFGKVEYSVKEKVPPKQSILMTTELKDGFIIADGKTPADAIQKSLDLYDEAEIISNKLKMENVK